MGVLLFLSLSMPPLVLVRDSERLMGTFVMYVESHVCIFTLFACMCRESVAQQCLNPSHLKLIVIVTLVTRDAAVGHKM